MHRGIGIEHRHAGSANIAAVVDLPMPTEPVRPMTIMIFPELEPVPAIYPAAFAFAPPILQMTRSSEDSMAAPTACPFQQL